MPAATRKAKRRELAGGAALVVVVDAVTKVSGEPVSLKIQYRGKCGTVVRTSWFVGSTRRLRCANSTKARLCLILNHKPGRSERLGNRPYRIAKGRLGVAASGVLRKKRAHI